MKHSDKLFRFTDKEILIITVGYDNNNSGPITCWNCREIHTYECTCTYVQYPPK